MFKKVVSEKWHIIKLELVKMLKAGAYAFFGAACSYLLVQLNAVDAGEFQVFVGAGVSFLTYVVNKVRKRTEYCV